MSEIPTGLLQKIYIWQQCCSGIITPVCGCVELQRKQLQNIATDIEHFTRHSGPGFRNYGNGSFRPRYVATNSPFLLRLLLLLVPPPPGRVIGFLGGRSSCAYDDGCGMLAVGLRSWGDTTGKWSYREIFDKLEDGVSQSV